MLLSACTRMRAYLTIENKTIMSESEHDMAVNGTTYVLNQTSLLADHECDEALEKILSEINTYLSNFSQSWIYNIVAHTYYIKCYRSWLRVNAHLEKFLKQPKTNYSMMMYLLEHEIAKFADNTFYCKKLKDLSHLISTGPEFFLYI